MATFAIATEADIICQQSIASLDVSAVDIEGSSFNFDITDIPIVDIDAVDPSADITSETTLIISSSDNVAPTESPADSSDELTFNTDMVVQPIFDTTPTDNTADATNEVIIIDVGAPAESPADTYEGVVFDTDIAVQPILEIISTDNAADATNEVIPMVIDAPAESPVDTSEGVPSDLVPISLDISAFPYDSGNIDQGDLFEKYGETFFKSFWEGPGRSFIEIARDQQARLNYEEKNSIRRITPSIDLTANNRLFANLKSAFRVESQLPNMDCKGRHEKRIRSVEDLTGVFSTETFVPQMGYTSCGASDA